MAGEFQYIAWLRARTPADARVLVGPGDDCAVLKPPSRPLLITTDMLMDGTDFVLAKVGPRRAGRKAMAANLSDIAAMAGVPMAAVVSVAIPIEPTPQPPPCREGVNSGVASCATPDVAELPVLFSPLPAGRGAGGVGPRGAGEDPSATTGEVPSP